MKIYFSQTLRIEQHTGIHFLQDHIGSNYSSPWDDYSFKTTFNVYVSREGTKKLLGEVKVLAKGFKDTSSFFSERGILILDKIYDITDALDASITVSLATDISYYQKVHKLFSDHQVQEILENTCDASYYIDNLSKYREWPGFSQSLLRNGASSEAIIKKGNAIAFGGYTPSNNFEISIDFPDISIETIAFRFSNTDALRASNTNIMIGKNGTGKTFVLRRLTELITGISKDAQKWPYFNKLLVAAYSPFETFYTKSALLQALDKTYYDEFIARKSRSMSLKRRLLHVNKYEYIGFRNDEGQFSLTWPRIHSAKSVLKIIELDLDNEWWSEKERFSTLFDTLRLCIDFDNIILKRKEQEPFRINKDSVLTKKQLRAAALDVKYEEGVLFEKDNIIIPLSSGQAIYAYLIPCLVAEIEDESLVVIDEPELYLHPALEIGLISMLKSLLSRTSSYALIATHSAVMAREVDKNYVKILRRSEGMTRVADPTFQTFGESLELIIGEAFDDFTEKKPYQTILDDYIKSTQDKERVLKEVGHKIGDEGLAYILNAFSDPSNIQLEEPDEIS